MKITLVVFDMAGTTVADEGAVARAFQQAMLQSGYDIPRENINPIMGYKKPEAINKMLHQYEADTTLITEEYIEVIHQRFIAAMLHYYETSNEVAPLDGVEEVFIYLKGKGIKIGLNTGFSKDIADTILNRLQWIEKGLVDFLVASDEVPAGRPQPYMIHKLMSLAGVEDPLEVIKVGDTEVDVNEGKNSGCLYSIAVTTGAFTKEELLPHEPSFIISNIREIMPIIESVQ